MKMDNIELTPRQKRLIPFLLTHNIVDACKLARVSRKAHWEWMKEENFSLALRQARQELFEAALGKIKVNMELAVDQLVLLMQQGEKEESRIRCAQTILEHGIKLRQLEDIERRLENLELALTRGR